MRISSIPKKKSIVLTAFLIIAVGAFYLWRDLHLSAEKISIPDIVVENIEMERMINGKKWKIISPRAEHRDGVVYGESLDITITDPGGRETHIYADKGTFTRENNDITMTNGDGRMLENGKEYNLKSGAIKYEAATERWHFAEGVVLSSDKMTVSGQNGMYDTLSGDCFISNGGTVEWGN
ncbi:MAG: LPS export ABC transporter periplasmic protein LptC [Synergistaceae bacterium]|nr:LPS export ABC transporter periplasmic protein LptC [Synergistaceae bacterium]